MGGVDAAAHSAVLVDACAESTQLPGAVVGDDVQKCLSAVADQELVLESQPQSAVSKGDVAKVSSLPNSVEDGVVAMQSEKIAEATPTADSTRAVPEDFHPLSL